MVERVGLSIDSKLLSRFDKWMSGKGYTSRSEAVRDLIRKALVEEEWGEASGEVAGAVFLVYDHEMRDLSQKLTAHQHRHHELIISSTHVHMDERNCLEVLILKGPSGKIKHLADSLISAHGVKHGRFMATTTGKEIP